MRNICKRLPSLRWTKGEIVIWRLLLGIVIGYLLFRAYRKIKESLSLKQQAPSPPKIKEPDTLLQDPVCGTFIPRREALKLVKDGKEYFFCSEGCLKRFRRSGDS